MYSALSRLRSQVPRPASADRAREAKVLRCFEYRPAASFAHRRETLCLRPLGRPLFCSLLKATSLCHHIVKYDDQDAMRDAVIYAQTNHKDSICDCLSLIWLFIFPSSLHLSQPI